MHEGLYKHVGETPLRMTEKGRGAGGAESLQKAACGECTYGCERERGKAAETERVAERVSVGGKASGPKFQFATLKAALRGKLMRAAENTAALLSTRELH